MIIKRRIVLLFFFHLLFLQCYNLKNKKVTHARSNKKIKYKQNNPLNCSNQNSNETSYENMDDAQHEPPQYIKVKYKKVKNSVFHTGEKTGELYKISVRRSGKNEEEYGKLIYEKYQVRHNGNCGAYSLIPFFLSFKKERLVNLFLKLHIRFVYELGKQPELLSNPYYQILRYSNNTNTYGELIYDVMKLILCLKNQEPSSLSIPEQDIIVKFIKETILLIYLEENKLHDFYFGEGEFIDTNQYLSLQNGMDLQNGDAKGLPFNHQKNWWLSQYDIDKFIELLTQDMSTYETRNEFSQTYYSGDIIDVTMSNIMTYKPPKILIKHEGDFFDYLVLKRRKI